MQTEVPTLPNLQLPDEDGIPLEDFQHFYQQSILLASLTYHWRHRNDFFAGANMFVYYSTRQAENILIPCNRFPPP